MVPCHKRKNEVDPDRLWLDRSLHIICTPNQRFLERLLLNDFTQIKPRHKKLIVHRVVQRDISVFDAIESIVADGTLTGQAASQATEYRQFIDDLKSRDINRIAPQIARRLGLDVKIVGVHVATLLVRVDEPEKEEVIAGIADLILPSSEVPPEEVHSIQFLTMHGSKGLTKKNVVIPGLEASWLPGNSQADGLSEKRRLFYVALTRATDRVLITFPMNRGRNDSLNFQISGRGQRSAFIIEAGLTDTYHD